MANKMGFNDRASGQASLVKYVKEVRIPSLVTGRARGTYATATQYSASSVVAGTAIHEITAKVATAAASGSPATAEFALGDGDDPDLYFDAILTAEIDASGETIQWHNDGADTTKDLKEYTSDDTIDLQIDAAKFTAGALDLYIEYTSEAADEGIQVTSTDDGASF